MEHELALKLKDAGFLQGGAGDTVYEIICEGTVDVAYFDPAYAPTLSELIEACIGEYWFTLAELKPHAWRAEGRTLDLKTLRGKGKTPEEAVAKLWLELNK